MRQNGRYDEGILPTDGAVRAIGLLLFVFVAVGLGTLVFLGMVL